MAFVTRREKRLWSAAGLCLLLIYASAFVARPLANYLRDRHLLRPTVLAIFLIAGACLLLWLQRHQPGWRVLSAAALVALVYTAVLSAVPMLPEEKLHFLEFGLVGGLVYLAWRERRQRLAETGAPSAWSRLLPAGVVAVTLTGLAGWLDEGLQGLLPDRYYDLRDVVFNTVAAALAATALWLVEKAAQANSRQRVA